MQLAVSEGAGAVIPEHVDDIATGKVEGEELKAMRARRSTAERLERLEEKYDRLVHAVLTSRTKIVVAACTAAGAIAGYLLGGCL